MKENCQRAFMTTLIRLMFICLLFALFTTTNAQTAISGTVLEGDKNPLTGASIQVRGKTKITTTNSAESFSINPNGKDVPTVSFVGFTTIEIDGIGRLVNTVE